MKINKWRLLLITSMAVIFIAVASGQGLYWESTISAPSAGKEMKSNSSYRPKMFKQSSENGTVIFRLDRKKIYYIDNQNKEYSEMTFSEMEAAAKQAKGQMEEMMKQMKDLPPEQREALEKRLGNSGMGALSKPKLNIVKTGETKVINGYSCVKYVLTADGKEAGTIWTTGGVPGYSKMKNEMKEFSERLMSQVPNGKELSAALKKVDGFPIETSIAGMTTTVTKVEQKSVSAGDFEVPAGYKKVEKNKLPGQ
jgi:hypothetical protein